MMIIMMSIIIVIIAITVTVTNMQAVHAMQREVFSKAADIKQIERQLASMRAAEDAQQEQVLALDAKQKRTEDQVYHCVRAVHPCVMMCRLEI